MNHRVCFRRRVSDEWETKEFATSQEAYAFHRAKRRALWLATIQHKHADGRWF